MARATITMLTSILMFIDINYMTDEECDTIYELDINNEKNQKDIIQRLIVPGVKSEYSVTAFNRAKEVLEMGIDDIKAATKIFNQMSFPFEDDIVDKKAFLKRIYEEFI